MTNHPNFNPGNTRKVDPGQPLATRRVLFAQGEFSVVPVADDIRPQSAITDLDSVIDVAKFDICRSRSRKETMIHVEAGQLAGAVVWGFGQERDELSLLAAIRSIDAQLPCWLVTTSPSRQALETALALRVASVITHPFSPSQLITALERVLTGPIQSN